MAWLHDCKMLHKGGLPKGSVPFGGFLSWVELNTSLCPQPLAQVEHTALSEFIARRARGGWTGSQMASGSSADVYQKGL